MGEGKRTWWSPAESVVSFTSTIHSKSVLTFQEERHPRDLPGVTERAADHVEYTFGKENTDFRVILLSPSCGKGRLLGAGSSF